MDLPAPADDWYVVRLIPLQSRLFRFIATLAPAQADVEDLFQKTMLTAWQERGRFEPDRDLFPWLCGVARNHVRNLYRSRERGPAVLAPDVIDQLAADLIREDEYYERRQSALTHCLDRLPGRQRTLIREFYQADQTVKEFAAGAGVGVQAAYKSLQRIHAALRECVGTALAREGLA